MDLRETLARGNEASTGVDPRAAGVMGGLGAAGRPATRIASEGFSAPQSVPTLAEVVELLKEQVANAEKLAAMFTDRLGPVAHPTPPEEEGQEPLPPAASPLASALLSTVARLARANDKFHRLSSRLDL